MEYFKKVFIFIFHLLSLSFKTFGQTPALNSTVRLVNQLEGRRAESNGIVELLGPNGWGRFSPGALNTNADVAVVCKQLGFKDATAIPITSNIYGMHATIAYYGSSDLVIKDVDCKGDEESVEDCHNSGWEAYDGQIASAVWCAEKEPELWLSGGRGEWEGNVEIEGYAGWGYMCNPKEHHYGYDLKRMTNTARVICVQQGFKKEDAYPLFGDYFEQSKIETFYNYKGSPGRNPFLISRFDCKGTEASLFDCKFDDTDPECTPLHAFAVSCKKDPIKYRLVGGERKSHGRLEVYGFGFWSPVCSNKFEQNDAAVACKSLGYKSEKTKPVVLQSHQFFGTSSKRVRLTGLECRGNENSLADCSGFILGQPPYEVDYSEGHLVFPCEDQIGIDCKPEPKQDCIYEGVTYSHYQDIPSIDKCQECKCKLGQKVCEAKRRKKCRA